MKKSIQPNKIQKICKHCNHSFDVYPSLNHLKYCSRKCYHEERKTWCLGAEWRRKISDGVKRNLPCTTIKKGQRLSPKTEFKKGEMSKKQIGKNNSNWKSGIAAYRRIAKITCNSNCERCKSQNKLLVHHKDENRYNNNFNNLMILCKRCHYDIHKELRRMKRKEWMIGRISRQGDVYIKKIGRLPTTASKASQEKNVIALGEVTGHKHQVLPVKGVLQFFTDNGLTLCQVEQEAELVHEEHETITLPKGLYLFGVQREQDIVEGVRQVMD